MGYGFNSHIGIGFQTAFGTSNVSSFHYVPIISESLTQNIPDLESEATRGRMEAGPSYQGAYEYVGDIVCDAHPVLVGKFLKGWFGQSSGTLTNSHYVHTFNPRTTDFSATAAVPPFTIEKYLDTGSAQLYSDMLINQLVIEVAQGAIVKATGSFIGANREKSTKTSPTYLTGSDYVWDQGSFSLAGAASDVIQDMTITMNNNLEAVYTLNGSKKPSRIKRTGFRSIEISGTMLFESDTEKDLFLAGTEQALIATFTGQALGDGTNASLKIDIPLFRYTEYPTNMGGPGLITVGFSGKAKYHSGSATMATLTLVNTLVSY